MKKKLLQSGWNGLNGKYSVKNEQGKKTQAVTIVTTNTRMSFIVLQEDLAYLREIVGTGLTILKRSDVCREWGDGRAGWLLFTFYTAV